MTGVGKPCSMYGREERCIQGLVGKLVGSRPHERPRRRLENNIKINLREMGMGAWTGSFLFRVGTGGGLFLKR